MPPTFGATLAKKTPHTSANVLPIIVLHFCLGTRDKVHTKERACLFAHTRYVYKQEINTFVSFLEWPWWKLYNRVNPLLSVSLADREQREWREKIYSLENNNSELRLAKTKLEGQIAELEQLIRQNDQTSHNLSLALERETEARIQLENDARLLQQKYAASIKAETGNKINKTMCVCLC